MESGEVYSLAVWQVKAGKDKEFIAAWESFARRTTKLQAGPVDGRLLRDFDRPQYFVSFGHWGNTEKLRSWLEQPEFKAFFARAGELCDDIKPYTLKTVAYVAPHSMVG
jgi:heme-degrading monooxygenase HmoA